MTVEERKKYTDLFSIDVEYVRNLLFLREWMKHDGIDYTSFEVQFPSRISIFNFYYHILKYATRLSGIAGLFTVFSSVVFTSSVVNFGRSDVADLK